MKLTAAGIKALQPAEKNYRKSDGGSLYVEVRPNGSKLWFFKFRFAQKEKRIGLGTWPTVSLAAARQLRHEAQQMLSSGKDPSHVRKMAKIAATIGAENTFQSVGERYIAAKLIAKGAAPSTIVKARRCLQILNGSIGNRPIAEIEPAELMASLKRMEQKGHLDMAHRTRGFASSVFRYGVSNAICKSDPAALLIGALARGTVRHHPALHDPVKIGQFMRDADAYTGGPIVKLAMLILPHVFLRPGELRNARWAEIDWEGAIWHVPAERTKMRRPHSVPLSSQVISLLTELKRHSDGFELMFPGQRSHLKPISENTLNATYRRMGYAENELVAHGFRSTASTLLNESGQWHPDAIERALAHGPSSSIRGAYARGEYWLERVDMAQWWSDHLDELKANVPTLKDKRKVEVFTRCS